MKGDFKTLLRRFCLESSVLGLKYFYLYPDVVSRCFWAITMVLTLCISFLLAWLLNSRFVDMPTRIAIENQFEPLNNVSFPAITLCTPNQVTISAMQHLKSTLVDGNETINLESILIKVLGFYKIFYDTEREKLEKLQNLITINRYTSLEVMGLLPQSCDDFLKLCFFKKKKYPNCKGLFHPILTKYGMCCIFNSIYRYDKNKRNIKINNFVSHKVSVGGNHEALTVVTDYNSDNALTGTLFSAGAIKIMFTDWSEFPADDESSLVQPNTESFHRIHHTYTYCSFNVAALPFWSRKCYFDDEHHLPHFTKYHNSDCDLLCIVRELERRCHCTMIYVPYVWLNHACNFTSIDCIVKAKRKINKLYMTDQCNCPRDCVSYKYQVHMDVGNLLSLQHMIRNPYSDIQFNKSTSILHFFFPNSVYVKQKQETVMSLINVVFKFSANLGGVFGLCLGCSLISVLEVLFYTYCAIRNKLKSHIQKSRMSKIRHLT